MSQNVPECGVSIASWTLVKFLQGLEHNPYLYRCKQILDRSSLVGLKLFHTFEWQIHLLQGTFLGADMCYPNAHMFSSGWVAVQDTSVEFGAGHVV